MSRELDREAFSNFVRALAFHCDAECSSVSYFRRHYPEAHFGRDSADCCRLAKSRCGAAGCDHGFQLRLIPCKSSVLVR